MHPIPTWATSSEPRRASLGSLLLLICSVTACHHKVLHLPVHLASSSILNSLSGSFPSLLHSFPDTLILCSLPYQPHWSIPATQAVHPANCHCTSPRIGSAARACFKTNYNPFGYTTPSVLAKLPPFHLVILPRHRSFVFPYLYTSQASLFLRIPLAEDTSIPSHHRSIMDTSTLTRRQYYEDGYWWYSPVCFSCPHKRHPQN